jgi:hypothetical protein
MYETQEPTVTEDTGVMGGTVAAHPAFGQISVFRSSGHSHLYGSEFAHQHTIRLRINPSVLHRQLSDDRMQAISVPLIEVCMSEAQFAHAITSVGLGEGTPCTITSLHGQSIPGLPAPKPKTEQFAHESQARFDKAVALMQEVAGLIDASKLSQKDKAALTRKLQQAKQEIGDNQDFVADRFAEYMETVVEKGRMEINAYATQTLRLGSTPTAEAEPPVLSLPGSSET